MPDFCAGKRGSGDGDEITTDCPGGGGQGLPGGGSPTQVIRGGREKAQEQGKGARLAAYDSRQKEAWLSVFKGGKSGRGAKGHSGEKKAIVKRSQLLRQNKTDSIL